VPNSVGRVRRSRSQVKTASQNEKWFVAFVVLKWSVRPRVMCCTVYRLVLPVSRPGLPGHLRGGVVDKVLRAATVLLQRRVELVRSVDKHTHVCR